METLYHTGQLLLFNKPLGWTSFDLVNKVRGIICKQYVLKRSGIKVGHAGTLDPLATGLMLLCTGHMTKQIERLQGMEKEYTGTFVLGATTPSFDLEKEKDREYPVAHITREQIHKAARSFIGLQEQEPPVFSAKIIDGKRAYEYARQGKEVAMKTSSIEIKEFEITAIRFPEIDFRVVCSKGTYIRSLARDFGLALHSGAFLSKLERTRIGEYRLENALDIPGFEQRVKEQALPLFRT